MGHRGFLATVICALVDTGAGAFIADANFAANVILCNPGALDTLHTIAIDGGKYLPVCVTGVKGSAGTQLLVLTVLCTHHKLHDGTVLYISVALGDLNISFIMPSEFLKK